METKGNRLLPARAVHPGEILREELKERNIKQNHFAKQLGMQATHLNEFIKGKRDMNEELAMKLEQHLDIPFSMWMRLHNGYIYDNKVLTEKQNEEQKAYSYETACAKIFNIKLLYKKLNLSTLPCMERVKKMKELFDFDLLSSSNLELQVSGLYKHSEKVQIDEKNMQTWLILNWLKISRETIDSEYQKGNGLLAAEEIATMANHRTLTIETIKECLYRYGISYVHVEKLDKAPIDAYSTFAENHPVITVTYRYNDIDKLAFDLLHELCHIEHHLSENHKAFISMEGTLYSKDPREKEANDFAKQHLIPDDVWKSILKKGCNSLSPHKIVDAIAAEAAQHGISPSIAISRFKHDTNWYQTSAYKSPKIN